MSTGLRTLVNPGRYYVSVDADVATHYTLNTSTGVWSSASADFSGKVFKDLGKISYFHPVNSLTTGEGAPASVAQTAPPVDVRKVAEVTTSGLESTGQVYYVPMGTRVRGTRAQQNNIPSCWVVQVAASVASARA